LNKRTVGNKKEERICEYLVENGYCVLEKNFFSRHGEIDIIATKGEYICFVEVKYRKDKSCGLPEEAVTLTKIRKICKTAVYYLYTHRQYYQKQMRFDVAAVLGEDIKYYENAFMYLE